MDDYGSGWELLRLIGVPVEPLSGVLRDPLFKYKASALPRARASSGAQLVLNYAAALRVSGGECIAWSSHFSYLDLNNNGAPDPGEPAGPFCVAACIKVGAGKVVVVSDSSIALNSMLQLNQEFLGEVLSGRLYLVADKWSVGPYTSARRALVGFVSLVFSTDLKYPAAAYISIGAFFAAKRLYTQRRARHLKPRLESVIRELLKKHPEWDSESVRLVAREVLELGESEGSR